MKEQVVGWWWRLVCGLQSRWLHKPRVCAQNRDPERSSFSMITSMITQPGLRWWRPAMLLLPMLGCSMSQEELSNREHAGWASSSVNAWPINIISKELKNFIKTSEGRSPKKFSSKPGTVTHSYNPNAQEADPRKTLNLRPAWRTGRPSQFCLSKIRCLYTL